MLFPDSMFGLLGHRRCCLDVSQHGRAGVEHRNVFITPEVLVARMKRRAGIRSVKRADVLEIARTIVDETQLHTETTFSILQRAASRLEEAKAWYLADEIRDLIEKIRNAERAPSS
jgi:hypothetical protein